VSQDQSKDEFVKIYSTQKQEEIAFIKSILETNKIPYYIKGENFGTLYSPLPFSMMDLMVGKDFCKEAKELLEDFINPSNIP
jgi:hypothetical protein